MKAAKARQTKKPKMVKVTVEITEGLYRNAMVQSRREAKALTGHRDLQDRVSLRGMIEDGLIGRIKAGKRGRDAVMALTEGE